MRPSIHRSDARVNFRELKLASHLQILRALRHRALELIFRNTPHGPLHRPSPTPHEHWVIRALIENTLPSVRLSHQSFQS